MKLRRWIFCLRNAQGSSLFEALVAASALLASLLSITGQASPPPPTRAAQEYHAQAMTFAHTKLEELRSLASSAAGGEDIPAPGFSRKWTVEKTIAESRLLTAFVVGVSWPGASPLQKIQLNLVTSHPLLPGAPLTSENTSLALRYSPLFGGVAVLYLLSRGLPRLLDRRRQAPGPPHGNAPSSHPLSANGRSPEKLRP